MISSKDISVVIQGPVDWNIYSPFKKGVTASLAMQIRKLLPEAEIIFSTWEGQKYDSIEYDTLIINEDPGAQGVWPSYVPSNVNRQIVSSKSGILAATRKYCLKIRSDMVLKSTKFIDFFEKAQKIPDSKLKVFSNPIVTNNFSSRDTKSVLEKLPSHPLPFHPSDHISFGLTTDVLYLWDIPLQSDEDAFYFMDRSHPNRFRLNEFSRLTPEQYIFTSAISKKAPVDIENYADSRESVIKNSEYYMNSHIVSVPDRIFSVDFPKYHTPHHFHYEWMRRNQDAFLLKKYASVPGEGKKRRKLPKPLRVAFTPFRKSWKYLKRVKRLFTD